MQDLHNELNDKVLGDIIRLVKSGATIKITKNHNYTPSISVSIELIRDNIIIVRDQGLMPFNTLENARDEIGLFAGHIDKTLTRFTKHLEFELNKES